MKVTMRILVAATLLALAPWASAQTTVTTNTEIETQARLLDNTAANKGQSQVAAKIAAFFTNLAGSRENALALVNALRNGTAINLTTPATGTGTGTGTGIGSGTGTGTGTTPPPTTTTFTPPTGKMGWGNVKIALALAQDALLRAGITKPTAAQLQIALMGGDIKTAGGTTVTLKGVLQMRSDGMGWGQIAHAGGTNVGPVVSSLKATQAQLAALPSSGGTGATTATTATTKGVTASGLVTAEGSTAGHQPKGNAYGRGIVTGSGSAVASSAAATGGGNSGNSPAGVVTASGASASGVTTAQGNGSEHGKGQGKGKGG
jgi:hypothetical protein